MDEKQFEASLLEVIGKYKQGILNKEEFVLKLESLAKQVTPKQISDFKDEELGWAKTWIDEIAYYGIDTIMQSKFNFFEFWEKRNLLGKQ